MSKAKQKNNIYNNHIINELKNKYGFSRDYILKSIRGDRTGTVPIKIQEEYKVLNREANRAVSQKIDTL